MTGPSSRAELMETVSDAYRELLSELERAGPNPGTVVCVDDWTVKELIAVRAWWTHRVVDWIEAGRAGESPVLPAPGYRWNETPRLNADIVAGIASESYASIFRSLEEGFERFVATAQSLSDAELLDAGCFEWAGKWPLSRWIWINTGRQYVTARTYVRRALHGRSIEARE